MATAVVTGARSGIGRAIAARLLQMGYRVVGISRSVTCRDLAHPDFEALPCDLSDFAQTNLTCTQLQERYNDITLFVNAAGFGRFEPHEELTPALIVQMVALNLTAPMLLCNALLRPLKRSGGAIINITSIEATRHSKFAALYSATKAGLRAFGMSLFEELRKSGVAVVTINPDMTDTPFFDALRFGPDGGALLAEDIADALESILNLRSGAVVTELTIRSQRFGIVKKSPS
ncbi:MAG: SDR family oxidoreductase [Campylobacterales bacterium]|nr:SDR family oxidoreductase [Campylobacterales bacterium]